MSAGRSALAAVITAVVLTGCGSTVREAVPDDQGLDVSAGPSARSDMSVAAPADLPAESNSGELAGGHDTRGGRADIPRSETHGRQGGQPLPVADATDDLRGKAKLGVVTYSKEGNEFYRTIGLGELSAGDGERNWRILLEDLNSRGGFAGRHVEPVVAFVDDGESDREVAFQRACTKLTQDNTVFAVVSDVTANAAFIECVAAAGVPLLYPPTAALDDVGMGRSPHVVIVASPDLSRAARGLVNGLYQQGFFEQFSPPAGAIIGLLRNDGPAFERATEQHLKPALAAHGLEVTEEQVVPAGADMVAQMPNAVLRFRSAGVTHLLMESASSGAALFFMQAAESQGYRPAYGVSTQQQMNTVELVVPSTQLERVVGVGWQPLADVGHEGDPGPLARAERCLQTWRDNGHELTHRVEMYVAMSACDGGWFLHTLTNLAGGLDSARLLRAVNAVGKSYDSALTFTTDFMGRRDGAASWRGFGYSRECECLRFTAAEGLLG